MDPKAQAAIQAMLRSNPVDFAGLYVPIQQGKIDIALSQFAKGYNNNQFIGDVLFPTVEVSHQSDKFWVFGRENQQTFDNYDLRAPASAAERIKQTVSTSNYMTVDHSLARLIPDEERGNFQVGDVEQWATQYVTDKLRLMREIRVAALATNTANYAGTNTQTLAGGNQWSDYVNSDPLANIETAKQQIRKNGMTPNFIVMGDDVFTKIIRHTKIVTQLQYSKEGLVRPLTAQDLALLFGVPNVYVGSAISVNAAGTPSFVWGKSLIVGYNAPSTTMYDPSFGKAFQWAGAPGTTGGFSTEIGRIQPPSAKADELAVHWYYGLQITSNISAYLFANAVA